MREADRVLDSAGSVSGIMVTEYVELVTGDSGWRDGGVMDGGVLGGGVMDGGVNGGGLAGTSGLAGVAGQ